MVKAIVFDCFGVLYVQNGNYMVRNQPLLDEISNLRSHYKIGVLSNIGTETMNSYFTQQERAALFDQVVISGEVGLTKPYADIFRLIAKNLGCEPADCIMVDDSEVNCSGALDAGFADAILYKDFDDTIQKLNEILNNA